MASNGEGSNGGGSAHNGGGQNGKGKKPKHHLLNDMPAELLRRCLEFAAPTYDAPTGIGLEHLSNRNPDSKFLKDVVSLEYEFLSEHVQHVALETSFTNISIAFSCELNRLLRLFGDDNTLASNVRKISLPMFKLVNRDHILHMETTGPNTCPVSPPESRVASPPPPSAPRSESSVTMEDRDPTTRDAVDFVAMMATPLAQQLVKHYMGIYVNLMDLIPREVLEDSGNVSSENLSARMCTYTMNTILFGMLIRETLGVTEIDSRLYGVGMMPAILSESDLDKPETGYRLHLPQLRKLVLGESFFPGFPFNMVDMHSLLLESAPNLEELTIVCADRIIRTQGYMELEDYGNAIANANASKTMEIKEVKETKAAAGASASKFKAAANTNLAPLAKLTSLCLDSCKLANRDLDIVMKLMPRPSSTYPFGLQRFRASVRALGTVESLDQRAKYPNSPAYYDHMATCYDTVHSLLPWKKTLCELELTCGADPRGLQPLTDTYRYAISASLHRLKPSLGTSLLPRFEGLKKLTISATLFNMCAPRKHIDDELAAMASAAATRETVDEEKRRVMDSLVYNLPPNLEQLTLLRPRRDEDAVEVAEKAQEVSNDATLPRLFQFGALDQFTDCLVPISALLLAMKRDGKFPHLSCIVVAVPDNSVPGLVNGAPYNGGRPMDINYPIPVDKNSPNGASRNVNIKMALRFPSQVRAMVAVLDTTGTY